MIVRLVQGYGFAACQEDRIRQSFLILRAHHKLSAANGWPRGGPKSNARQRQTRKDGNITRQHSQQGERRPKKQKLRPP